MSSPSRSAILSTGTGGLVIRFFLSKCSTVSSMLGITTPSFLEQFSKSCVANWIPSRSAFQAVPFPEWRVCFLIRPSEYEQRHSWLQEGVSHWLQHRGCPPSSRGCVD